MALDKFGPNAFATGSVTSDALATDAVATVDIEDGSISTAKLADGAVTGAKAVNLGRRNLVINGAMQVAQRGTSFTGVTSGTTYGADRFSLNTSVLLSSTYDITNSSDAPDGFSNSFKIDCQTVDTSMTLGEYVILAHSIEAQNLQHLNWGSSSAKNITLSFWVKSNKTATYFVELEQSDTGDLNPQQWTVDSADTWEYKTLTFSGNTSGAINNDNGKGLGINIWLAAGANYTSGTYTADTWHTTNANRVVGIDNFVDSTSNYINFTGFQLEVGDTATPFEHRSYGEEFLACQRYYCKNGAAAQSYYAYQYTNSFKFVHIQFPVQMRAAPSVSFTMSAGSFTTYLHDEAHWKAYGSSAYNDTGTYKLTDYAFDAEL